MENTETEVKTKFTKPVFELDKTGPTIHVKYKPDYNDRVLVMINGKGFNTFKLTDGKASIQLPTLPREYSIEVKALKK